MASTAAPLLPEKSATTTTVQPVGPNSSNEENGIVQRPDRDVRNAIWAITTGVALPCIPILVILAVLLYFIYHNLVPPIEGYAIFQNASTLQSPNQPYAWLRNIHNDGGKPAYLVDYSATTLTTIAGWTSRIIPYLTSSIMALVAFFAARYIVSQSSRGDDAVLPDPEQLTLLIGLLGGNGVTPLKDTLFYSWLKKERLVSPVPAVFWTLLLITFLGLVMPIIDSWFGIATHSITITTFTNTSASQYQQYGRTLNPTVCPNGPNGPKPESWPTSDESVFWPCSVDVIDPRLVGSADLPHNFSEVSKMQNGMQTHTVINNYTQDAVEWFYYSDIRANDTLDFVASSPAISTQCSVITGLCLHGDGLDLDGPFNCSSGFSGNFSRPWPLIMDSAYSTNSSVSTYASDASNAYQAIVFASDSDLTSTPPLFTLEGSSLTWPTIEPKNPSNFVTWSHGIADSSYLNARTDNLTALDGIFVRPPGPLVFFLQCSVTAAEVTYTHAAGNRTALNVTTGSPELNALLTSYWTISGAYSVEGFRVYTNRILADMAFGAVLTANVTADLATTWSRSFSRSALSLSLGAFMEQPNILEQHRSPNTIVARVPLAPLYLLVCVKLVYVIAVIALAIGAYAFTHPAETEVVKAQLSTKGLAAAHFDQPDLLQQNAVKAVEQRLQHLHKSNTDPASVPALATGSDPSPGGLKRADTSPAMINGGKPKVGIVPDAEGTWKFVVMANGVWHHISPIVKTIVETEARKGNMGGTGDLINAWKG